MFGDILENANPDNLRSGPGMPGFGKGLNADHVMLSADAPSNAQILEAAREFYFANQVYVDGATNNCHSVSTNTPFVSALNGNTNNWQDKQLTQPALDQTNTAIFGKKGDPHKCNGLFGPILCNPGPLFSTISVGVSVEAIFIIGGMGGLGCSFDITQREGPKGYGYAAAEIGLKVALDVNVQATMFTRLPSNLNLPIFGINATIAGGFAASFLVFYTLDKNKNFELIGYSVAIGIGGGAGVAVFGGHLWNFG